MSEIHTKRVAVREIRRVASDRAHLTPLDRESVARFVLQHADQIRSIARRNLTQHALTCVGSDDILSSVLRRVDEMSAESVLRPISDGELWRLIESITIHTAVSYTRSIERAVAFMSDEGSYAQAFRQRLKAAPDESEAIELVQQMVRRLRQDDAHHMFVLRARGASHEVIAEFLGISPEAARKRWSSACQVMLEILESSRPAS